MQKSVAPDAPVSHKTLRAGVACLALALLLGGCSSVKSSLGMGKNSPDEFAVVKKAPLIRPPDYKLRPPRPGAPRPTAVAPENDARTAVFGQKAGSQNTAAAVGMGILTGNNRPSVPKSTGEMALLGTAGADPSQADVRSVMRLETTSVAEKGISFSDRLMFWQGEEGANKTIDAGKESARLKKAAEEGKPASSAQAPVIRRKKQTLLGDLF